MDGLGALALGSEPALKKYMREKPKSRSQSIVSKKMMEQVIFSGAWVTVISLIFLRHPFFMEMFDSTKDFHTIEHMTAYFSIFVLAAVFNGFNVRSEGLNLFENIKENTGFIKVMAVIVVVQILLTFVGGSLFNCTPITLEHWIVVTLLAITIIPVDMIRKFIVTDRNKEVSLEQSFE